MYPPVRPPNLQEIFKSVDRDRSGYITDNELQQALGNGSWMPFNIQTCRLMINIFDTSGDGKISFREFQSLWQYINEWTRFFQSYDRDNSGSIDKRELKQALTQCGYRLSDSFYNVLVKKFDRTRKGRILFDDFVQLCIVLQVLTAAFRDKDRDRDGYITVHYEDFLKMVLDTKL